jgi:hypothetical protein
MRASLVAHALGRTAGLTVWTSFGVDRPERRTSPFSRRCLVRPQSGGLTSRRRPLSR